MYFQQQWIFFSGFISYGFHHPVFDGLIQFVVEDVFLGEADSFLSDPIGVQLGDWLCLFTGCIASMEFEGTVDVGSYIDQLFGQYFQLGDARVVVGQGYDLLGMDVEPVDRCGTVGLCGEVDGFFIRAPSEVVLFRSKGKVLIDLGSFSGATQSSGICNPSSGLFK